MYEIIPRGMFIGIECCDVKLMEGSMYKLILSFFDMRIVRGVVFYIVECDFRSRFCKMFSEPKLAPKKLKTQGVEGAFSNSTPPTLHGSLPYRQHRGGGADKGPRIKQLYGS